MTRAAPTSAPHTSESVRVSGEPGSLFAPTSASRVSSSLTRSLSSKTYFCVSLSTVPLSAAFPTFVSSRSEPIRSLMRSRRAFSDRAWPGRSGRSRGLDLRGLVPALPTAAFSLERRGPPFPRIPSGGCDDSCEISCGVSAKGTGGVALLTAALAERATVISGPLMRRNGTWSVCWIPSAAMPVLGATPAAGHPDVVVAVVAPTAALYTTAIAAAAAASTAVAIAPSPLATGAQGAAACALCALEVGVP
mmetsp:Transcript_9808/g.40461  ORF Transcript_9808/g.40461 Transcript_9808/m.40461 type:complete len:249 (+) Transcript_9808:441-1187(+)